MNTAAIDADDKVVDIDSDDEFDSMNDTASLLSGVSALSIDSSDEDKSELKIDSLLQRLLDVSNPVITPQVVEFLLQPGVCAKLAQYITRMRDTPKEADEPRDVEDMNAVRRSHQAMVILTRNANSVHRVLSQRWEEILRELLNIFSQKSDGVLRHVPPVWKQMLLVAPTKILFYLKENEETFKTFMELEEESVGYDLIMETISCNSETAMKHLVVEQMGKMGLLSQIIERCVREDEDSSSGAVTALDRILEESGKGVGYHKVIGPEEAIKTRLSELVDILLSATTVSHQKVHAIQVLNILFTRWESITAQSTETPLVPDYLHAHLLTRISDLCTAVVNFSGRRLMQQTIKFSGYSVNNSLTTLCLDTNTFIYAVLTKEDSTLPEADVLESIPASYWKNISTSFFSHEHCSIFHILYYRFVNMILKAGHTTTLKNFFSKPKLISRLVDELTAGPSGKTPIMLLVCNLIRLKAECEAPSSYLRNLLSTNPKWVDFQEPLKKMSADKLVGSGVQFKSAAAPSTVHFGPRLIRYDSLGMILDDRDAYFTDDDDDKLGFGSKFSHYVGLGDLSAYDESAHKTPAPVGTFSDAALIADFNDGQTNGHPTNTGPKKKSNTKKKKKKGNK